MSTVPNCPSNPYLFATHDDTSGCFTSSLAHTSFKKIAQGSPIPLNTSTYRQVTVSIAKKHMPTLVAPFDPNTPKDYNGFLRLLAFQTGHKPSMQAGTYALEHGFPVRLQPDLINRYLENSNVWHEFTMTRASDVIHYTSGLAFSTMSDIENVSYFPDHVSRTTRRYSTPDTTSLSEMSQLESTERSTLDPDISQCKRQRLKGSKRRRGTESLSLSPMSQKIANMQQQLDSLLEERASKRRRTKKTNLSTVTKKRKGRG